MSRIVVLGGGVSGHTTALFLRKKLGRGHEVVMVTPNSHWNWIPSNVWVGVGGMTKEQVTFPLAPVYKKQKITYKQAFAVSIHPEGNKKDPQPYVTIQYTSDDKLGQTSEVAYDYLVNATGPKLNFDKTPGLGPGSGCTVSICTPEHALQATEEFEKVCARVGEGNRATIVIGTGHGTCTCQGAAFEYLMNIEHELNQKGIREQVDLVYLTNESMLGDFGVGGMYLKMGGYITHSKAFVESLFAERRIGWVTGAHVQKITKDKIYFEKLDGSRQSIKYDFSMLIPPFSGVGLKAISVQGKDITEKMFKPNGFMIVDADYTAKPYEKWNAADWPKTLQSPLWPNIFAVGIAFAPPHAISKPKKSKKGTPITPAPPRTGMPSAMMGKAVALNIAFMIKNKSKKFLHTACMSQMGAACVASAGQGITSGSAVSMTMFPVVQDFEKYPEYGRSLKYTTGEIGLAGHWIKLLLHYLFIYKAKARFLWWLIPE